MLRGAFVALWYRTGQQNHISADGTLYYEIAGNVTAGRGFRLNGELTSRRPPGYPLFLAFMIKFFDFPLSVYIAQAVLSAGTCVLVYFLTKQIFDENSAILAAAFMAVDYASIRQVVSVMSEVLFVFFLIAGFFYFYKARDSRKGHHFLLSGIFMAAALLVREVILYFIPLFVAVLWIWKKQWKITTRMLVFYILGILLMISPWSIRNSLLYGKPVLFGTTAGHTLYFGNNPTVPDHFTGGDWELGLDTNFPKDPHLPPLFTVQADRYFYSKAIEFIRENPERFLKLTGEKMVNMWRPYISDSRWPAKIGMSVTYLPVIFLGIAGMALSARQWPAFWPIYLLIGYLVIIHAFTISHIRYRFPIMPFIMIFGGYAAALLQKKIQQQRKTVSQFGVL